MRKIKVRDIVIGQGRPKIAVAITGVNKDEIKKIAKNIDKEITDIVEWRADYFEDVYQIEEVLEILKDLRKTLVNIPIIFTFRSRQEGGKKDISIDYYTKLNKTVASSGFVDLIDIETLMNREMAKMNIDNIHRENILVIGSNHSFLETPSKEEMKKRLTLSQSLGADILKLAVMPKDTVDVLNLLYITNEMKEQLEEPLITMAMGKLGVISRIFGELFGSSVTFGAMDSISAPGQIIAKDLVNILNLLD